MDLTSEYESLLRYLETEKNKWELVKKPTPVIKNTEPTEKFKKLEQDVAKPMVHSTSVYFDVSQFEQLARESLKTEFQKRYSKTKNTVSVSELLSCVRKNYYFRCQTPLNLNQYFRFVYLQLIQEVGNTVHTYIQSIYKFDEVEKSVESKEYNVRGRLDAIIRDCVVEIKTIDQDKFKGIILPEHYNQALIYAYMLNKYYDIKINAATIVYVIRNLKSIVSIDIIFNWNIDNKKAEMLLNRANILLNAVTTKTLPDPIGSTSEECKYCPYKGICGKNTNVIINEPKKDDGKIVVLL